MESLHKDFVSACIHAHSQKHDTHW